MADLEDALKKLDRLTQEEARMALAEMLRVTHNISDEVKIVDGKVERVENKVEDVGDKVGDKVEGVGDKVEEVGDKVEEVGGKVGGVGDKVQRVDDKVQVIIDGAGACPISYQTILTSLLADGKQARVTAQETKLVVQHAADEIDEIKCSWLPNLAIVRSPRLILLAGNQFIQLLRSWLSPADPSTNHNIARKAQHKGTAAWLFQGQVIIKWKSTGSLLWIHGKRALPSSSFRRATLTDPDYLSGLWEERHLVRFAFPPSGRNSFFTSSSVIQDVMAVCEAGSAIMAYFYFDFKDLRKQTCHDLLRSLVFQLSTDSSPCCDILHRVYRAHKDGTQQPSDDTLKECLKQMLGLSGQRQVFIVLDALDECPDASWFPPPRSEVLQFVKELVDLRLPGLYICATSRPEVDIRAVLEPLAFRSVSLHDEIGQKTDIADYVRNVVDSPPTTAMRRWRADDKNLVIETLTERADGM